MQWILQGGTHSLEGWRQTINIWQWSSW